MIATEPVQSPQQLLATCRQLGYPVVIKALIPGVIHKADQQLVHTDINDDDQALTTWKQLSDTVDQRGGHIVVQTQLRAALAEIIVATRDDPHYGHHIMIGAGGKWVETEADIAWASAPITPIRAAELIGRTRIGRGLTTKYPHLLEPGGLPDVIAAISQLATDWSESVAEIEINPLIVQSNAITAVDAVITLRNPDPIGDSLDVAR
jgi:acetate---CoA ligase (ADP-forming)